VRPNILLVIFIALALGAGFLISQYPPYIVVCAALVLAIFMVAFTSVEWGLYILIFSMLLSPEINIGYTTGATLQRGVTLRFEDFLLVLIGFSWFARTAVKKELGLFLRTPLNKAILFYVLVCLISTGLGIMADRVGPKTGALFVLKYIEYFIVYFMVVNCVRDTDQVRRLLICLFLTCCIISIYGILQIPGEGRVSAPFEGEGGEPNTFGGYLVFMGAIAGGLFVRTENAKLKSLLPVLMLMIILPLLFTRSRSSYIAVIPAFFTLGLLLRHRVIILGLMAAALLLSPIFLPSAVKDRILFTFTQEESSGQVQIGKVRLDTSTSARIISLKTLLQDYPNHPVLGYGITGYQFIDAQYPKVLIETGIIGLIAFLYLLYSILKMAIAHMKAAKTPLFKGLTVGFLAGFIGLLFHAAGANTFIIVRIMEPFWFFAGIIAVIPALESQNEMLSAESARRTHKFAAATPLSS
jgi:O-antigen ligase